jgi:UDP-N-acetyl-D-mannosaminuronate dehydrogenase
MKLADVVVVDVQCDYVKRDLGNLRTGRRHAGSKRASPPSAKDPPNCLVLIETTVAPGRPNTSPTHSQEGFEKRGIESEPLLAHSFERVMPGRHYVAASATSGASVPV